MEARIKSKAELEQFVTSYWDEINQYLDEKMSEVPAPIYSSVDIRESKTKYAPVDCNIYPAGFNNLCNLDLDASTKNLKKAITRYAPEAQTVGVIPESNTKNTFYLDHLAILGRTIRDAGFDVRFISFDQNLFPEAQEELHLVSAAGFDVSIETAKLSNSQIEDVDFVLLNNDQSHPLEVKWDEISTPVYPTPKIGWFARRKSRHFCYYEKVVADFCERFSIAPDLLQAKFRTVDEIDFSSKQGFEIIARNVDELLKDLPLDSAVFVKADQGTYGMGISVVKSGEEILSMNRKARNKMDIGKNKLKFTSVIIQEGIETILKYDDMAAEVSIYLIDGNSVGGFMRANSEKGTQANLNARGMVFKKFCISEIRQDQDHKAKEAVYTIIARLSTLASGHEIKAVL